MRRYRPSWMTPADEKILEFLSLDWYPVFVATPAQIALNIDVTRSHVNTRVGVLREHGMVERVDEDKGAYRITDYGIRYLEGNLKAEDMGFHEAAEELDLDDEPTET